MAHLERKNDPLVKGGWKTVQMRHTESKQCGDKHLRTRISAVVAKRTALRGALDELSVEKAPSQKNSTKKPRAFRSTGAQATALRVYLKF